jgi:hypothetical protein
MRDFQGKYIVVNCWNRYFEHVSKMILEYYDKEEYNNTVFILGSYIFHPFTFFKDRYKNKKIIIYQMEQLFLAAEPHWVDVHKVIKNLTEAKSQGVEIWEMCSINEVFLKHNGVIVDKVIPLKFTKSLKELNTEIEPEIDLFFYGNLNARRSKFLARLAYNFYHKDISVMWISNLDFDLQKKYIEKSKIILNIHHTDTFNRQEQPRIFYALINKKCVLSEPSQKNYFGEAIVEAKDFTDSVHFLLENNRYKTQAQKGYEIFKKM